LAGALLHPMCSCRMRYLVSPWPLVYLRACACGRHEYP
jgi:hypothetical protein